MIKIFRNIRQKLVTKGKTTNYLKYAIGEIILVVIGILIALQINNWNENLKVQKQEIIYLQNLKDDLQSQIALLDIYITFEDIMIDHSNEIASHYQANKGFKNMDTIFVKLNDLSVRWTFSNVNTTLLEMLNSNQINIISNNKLKQDLIAFNTQLESFAANTQNNNTNHIDNWISPSIYNLSAYGNNGYSGRLNEMFKSFYLNNYTKIQDKELDYISEEIINEPKNRLKLINNVILRNGMANMQKTGNETLKKRALEVLSMIENELNIKKK